MSNIKKLFIEFLKTLSAKQSLFSFKKVERALILSTVLGITIACATYLIRKDKFTAFDCGILISPLLVAGGYTLNKIEEAKNKKDLSKDE